MSFFDFLKKWKASRDDEEGFPPLPQEDFREKAAQFEGICETLLPCVTAENLDQQEELVSQRLLGTLTIRYFWGAERTEPLKREQLPDGQEETELQSVAVENLLREQKFSVRQTNFGAYGLQGEARYTSAFLLAKDIWSKMAEKLGEDLVLMVPTGEIILFAPISKQDVIAQMGEASRGLYRHSQIPLTEKRLCYRKDIERLELWD